MSAGVTVAAQRSAARLLADLLDDGLPLVGWEVCDVYPGRLSGHIGTHTGDLAHRLSGMRVFARLLGVPAVLTRYTHHEGGAIRLRGVLRGVPVTVWTVVDAAELAALDGPQDRTLSSRWGCGGCRAEMFALDIGVPIGTPTVCPSCELLYGL